MGRLFTFGCSFTMWPWPTWSDIMAYELKMPYQNWAIPGLGNVGIASRVLECDLLNNFTKDDIILIVWSTWTREDRFRINKYPGHGWTCTGDVHYAYDKSFIDNYCSLNNDLYKNSTAIIQTNRLYKDNIKFNGHMTVPLIQEYENKELAFDEDELELTKFYIDHVPNDGDFGSYQCSYAQINEGHPDVLTHLKYAVEVVAPKMNHVFSQESIDYFTNIHNSISQFCLTEDLTHGVDYRLKIQNYLKKEWDWFQAHYHGFMWGTK